MTDQPPPALVDDVGVDVAADVVVIGDGPAGSTLAAALHRLDVDVALVGPGAPWTATYTTWADDLEGLGLLEGVDVWAHHFDQIAVRFGRARVIDRPYGVLDNGTVRSHLWRDVRHVIGTVADPEDLTTRLVVDATGWPSKLTGSTGSPVQPSGWQTAFGAVFAEPPAGLLGTPTMMDFSDPRAVIAGRESIPTFAYSLPVTDGWLVEETVLTASPSVDPDALQSVLASRLGLSVDAMLSAALATERVSIPMGAPPPRRDESGPIRFGAAAGMIHPATGYSIGSALGHAERVATAIASELERGSGSGAVDPGPVRAAVWSPAARRTRQLHDYGHDVLLRLDREGVQRFFDTFFDLPIETWSPYMRIDTPPTRLAGVMTKMFARAPMRLRSRLVTGDPRRFVRMLRP